MTIPNGVTRIAYGAFSGCTRLTSVTIPNSATSIDSSAFSFCGSLPSVTIPNAVTSIGIDAFYYCTNLTGVYFRGNAPSGGSSCSVFDGDNNATVYYVAGTTGWGATFGCRPTVLWCTGTTLAIPSAISPSCGTSVSTTTPTLTWGNVANESGYVVRVFSGGSCSGAPIHTSSQLAVNTTSYQVPSAAGLLNGQTYSWQAQAKGDGTTYCDGNWSACCAFSISAPCTNLSTPTPTAPVCGSTVSTITPTLSWTDVANESGYVVRIYGGGSCSGTPIHTSSQLPANATSYGVPVGVLQAGQMYSWQVQAKGDGAAFCNGDWSGCCSFAALLAQFTYTTNNGTITITKYIGSGGAVTIPGTIDGLPVISIGTDAFRYCNSLTSVVIADTVTTIGSSAFYECLSLTNIAIPNSVTTIGSGAFQRCRSLPSVTIPTSVTMMGDSAFSDCESLSSVTIPTSLSAIVNQAFDSCYGLTNVVIPNSITTIGNYAFMSCSSLSTITIPNSVTNIGRDAFYSCDSLTSFVIPDSVTSIGEFAFCDCSQLATVMIGNGISSIGYKWFEICGSLTNVSIPNSVTSIGDFAFSHCVSLPGIKIPNSVTNIGDHAFYLCTSLTNITIPASVTSIEGSTFSSCASLTGVYFRGNAPSGASDCSVFTGDNNATVYYLAGTTGWGATFGCRPTALYTALITPAASSPSCASSVSTTTPTLNWTDVANESGYVVRIYSQGSCSGASIHTSAQLAANATSYVVPAGVLAAGQTYSWQVQARGNGTTYWDSDWSACCSFSITTPLSTPTPTAPACGSTASTTTPALSWGDVANESGYLVRIYSGGSCSGTPIHTSSQLALNITSYVVPAGLLQASQTYSWQVQAKGDGATYGDGNWSGCCSFAVVLTDRLQVRAVGQGTLSPNYSNAVLEVGKLHTMKATAGAGFAFTSWVISTNWVGGVTTNNATVQFLMQSNLTLQVNFVDAVKPTLAITAPTANQRWSNAVLTVKGTVKDNAQLAAVWCQTNGVWGAANLGSGGTNWTVDVALVPGTNTVRAYAEDGPGHAFT